MDRKYLTTKEAATLTTYTEGTLRNLRSQGQGPPTIKLRGGRVLYPEDELREWIEQQRVTAISA